MHPTKSDLLQSAKSMSRSSSREDAKWKNKQELNNRLSTRRLKHSDNEINYSSSVSWLDNYVALVATMSYTPGVYVRVIC